MAKAAKRLQPCVSHDLTPQRTGCPHCGTHMRADYTNRRTLATLATGFGNVPQRVELKHQHSRRRRPPSVRITLLESSFPAPALARAWPFLKFPRLNANV